MQDRIFFEGGALRKIAFSDIRFINELFVDGEVRQYYLLSPEFANDLESFVRYLLESGRCVGCVIEDELRHSVGLITAEVDMDSRIGNVVWNVGYAILPRFRRMGYATKALASLVNYLQNAYSIGGISLDICEGNTKSEYVARRCGFVKSIDTAYVDGEQKGASLRYKWFKSFENKRIVYFNQAANAYRMKDYARALDFFQLALKENYQVGTPHTDAQILSNMGMACSSLGRYREAFEYLRKAQGLGLTNPSIEKELAWLRTHKGLC